MSESEASAGVDASTEAGAESGGTSEVIPPLVKPRWALSVSVASDERVRRVLLVETVLVLGLSLGRSAVYAVLSIINSLTVQVPLNQQTTSINNSTTPDRPWLDLTYQLVGIALPLVAVVLALFLLTNLHSPAGAPWQVMGLARANLWGDCWRGFVLFAAIGIPGLAFYLFAVHIGINLNVSSANLAENWWTIPVYVLSAAENGILEEVLMVGYLFTRWLQSGWSVPKAMIVSALVRGSYHLYQGFGGFIGNFVMGLAFGWLYAKTKRVGVLVVAHTLLDIVSFVGYALLKDVLTWI